MLKCGFENRSYLDDLTYIGQVFGIIIYSIELYITVNFPGHLPAVRHDNSWFNSKDIC